MNQPTPAPPRTEILFFDGFDDLDSIAPLESLPAAGFPVRAVGFPGEASTVRSAHGLTIGLDGPIGEAPDLILVPGGGWRDGSASGVRALSDGELPSLLARLHARGTVVASVCTGAMLLAAAGLLEGRPAVTNRIALEALAQSGAGVRADARVVDDGSIVTCGGPAAGIDLALRLVERFLGPGAATAAAERLEHERIGPTLVSSP